MRPIDLDEIARVNERYPTPRASYMTLRGLYVPAPRRDEDEDPRDWEPR